MHKQLVWCKRNLLAIKLGRIDYEIVASEIEQLLLDVENAAANSRLPDQCNMTIVNELIVKHYYRQITEQ